MLRKRRFVSWGVGMFDLDNDSFPDIFLVTGQVYPELEAVLPKYPREGPRIIFRNHWCKPRCSVCGPPYKFNSLFLLARFEEQRLFLIT